MSRVVRDPECLEISGVCNMHRGRLEKAGLFPKRFKLNPDAGPFGAVGWDFDELMQWLQERRASRDGAPVAEVAEREDTTVAKRDDATMAQARRHHRG